MYETSNPILLTCFGSLVPARDFPFVKHPPSADGLPTCSRTNSTLPRQARFPTTKRCQYHRDISKRSSRCACCTALTFGNFCALLDFHPSRMVTTRSPTNSFLGLYLPEGPISRSEASQKVISNTATS